MQTKLKVGDSAIYFRMRDFRTIKKEEVEILRIHDKRAYVVDKKTGRKFSVALHSLSPIKKIAPRQAVGSEFGVFGFSNGFISHQEYS